jgi:hypothetical protein
MYNPYIIEQNMNMNEIIQFHNQFLKNSNKNNYLINNAVFKKKAPVKVLIDDTPISHYSSGINSEETDEQSKHLCGRSNENQIEYFNLINNLMLNSKELIRLETIAQLNKSSNKASNKKYLFNILKSRKKDKKQLRKKYNKIVSRVHNMDCLLKKIKA